MNVILLADIKSVGRKGDVKNLADGYVRNFLLPKNLVIVATPKALEQLSKEKTIKEKERATRVVKLETEAKELQGLKLFFSLKTGEKDEVFGSVSRKDIEETLAEKDFHDLTVNLARPIKKLGEHEVEVDLNEGIRTTIKIVVLTHPPQSKQQ